MSEHIETLVELDIEYAELAHDKGVQPYLRAPAVGIEPLFIDALAEAAVGPWAEPASRRTAGVQGGLEGLSASYGRYAA